MMTMRILSVTFGLLSAAVLIYVDIEIAARYNMADGKTKGLFGIIEVLEFNYRYLILIPAMLSMLLTMRLFRAKNFKPLDIGMLLIQLITIVGIVTPSWKLFTD